MLTTNTNIRVAKVQPIESPVKEGLISVSLLNIERDTSAGIHFAQKQISLQHLSKGNPIWHINFHIIIAATFPTANYTQSLKLMMDVMKIIQLNHILEFDNPTAQYTIEPVNLSFHELANVWGLAGGSYHPSLVCKVKSITIDGENVLGIDTTIQEKEINL